MPRRHVHLVDDGQRLPAVDIDDRQQPDFRAVSELVGDEVHAPRVVGMARLHAGLPTDGHLAPLLAPGAQLQLLQAVPAIGLIQAQLEAFPLEQHMQAPIAPAHAHLGELT